MGRLVKTTEHEHQDLAVIAQEIVAEALVSGVVVVG